MRFTSGVKFPECFVFFDCSSGHEENVLTMFLNIIGNSVLCFDSSLIFYPFMVFSTISSAESLQGKKWHQAAHQFTVRIVTVHLFQGILQIVRKIIGRILCYNC